MVIVKARFDGRVFIPEQPVDLPAEAEVELAITPASPVKPSVPSAQIVPLPKRIDPKGMFAHRGVRMTAEEIDEARREAWADFPRDFPEGATP